MKKIKFILLVITIIFIVTGCPDFLGNIYRIKIHNKTNDAIRFYINYNYSDTSISQNKPVLLDLIRPQRFVYFDSKKKWEEVLVPPNDTMSIFFFSESVVNTHTWEEIRDSYLILKRYDLSYYDLKYLKWEVTYPPTEKMKNMRMYPPYGQ